MNLNSKIAIILGSALFCACKSSKMYEVPPSVRAFGGKSIIAPPGMVYVPTGTIYEIRAGINVANSDSISRKVSLSPFFIDATEVSNKQYRKFVDWLADSVAVLTYLKNDSRYFLKMKIKKQGSNAVTDSVTQRINWSRIDIDSEIPFWKNNSESFPGLVKIVNGRKVLNRDMIKFTFSHIQADGSHNSKTVTDTVKVLPFENVWATDFPNSQSEFFVNSYFVAKGFDNYPVVGVTWKQARAYTSWRTIVVGTQDIYSADMGLVFSLPTEAQWQYAAEIGESNAGSVKHTHDSRIRTVPVKANTANKLGIYNMMGNVSEWTLDAYSPSALVLVEDHDPALLLDVPDDDFDIMKRKVVTGLSWKDNFTDFNNAPRNYEIQNVAHSYIGFRCAMAAPDILTKNLATRKFVASKKTEKKITVVDK
jgi:sulfatase modifying factor 1